MHKHVSLTRKDSLNSLEQTEFYRLLVNSIEDYAIFLLDPQGKVASWNRGAQKLKGYKASEIIGKHFSIFYPKKDAEAGKPARKLLACQQYGRIEDEGWRIRKDGSRFWANVIITALRKPDGTLVGYAKITRDLTERKKHEDALSRANLQLKRQHSILEHMNKAKDEFISLASHQLRTPASAVKQFLGLLLAGYTGPLEEQQRSFIQKAYDSNDRQIELVNDLLRVAQVDAGQVVLHTSNVDITALIHDIVGEQRDSFAKKQQTVTLRLPATPTYAQVDQGHFRMALENIIDNASKYTPAGGAITISLAAQAGTISITVADTGVGIPSDSLPKLFNKFSRIPNELSEHVGGSGLGLYWAYKMARLHGGDIRVTSQLGKGSVFEVVVPQAA